MKKLLACILGTVLMLVPLAACAESGPSSSGNPGGSGGTGGSETTEVSAEPLKAGLLRGATAQISEAESLGIRARAENAQGGGAQALSFAAAAPQSEETPDADIVKNAEFVLKDGRGVYSEVEFSIGEEEITLSGENAQITKLYSVQGLTFFAAGIVPPDSAKYFTTVTPLEIVSSQGSASVQPRGDGRHYFARVAYELAGSTYTGYVPCRTYAGDHYYEVFNYWNDDLNRSFVMDNKTGEVYDLGAVLPQSERYIQSVENGILQMASGKFMNVEIREGRLALEEISLETAGSQPYSVLKDKYGHLLIEPVGIFGPVSEEIVSGDRLIVERDTSDRDNWLLWDRYRMGSDGRIYKFVISLYPPQYRVSEEERGIFYLDENMQWKPVEKDANTDIPNLWIYDGMYRTPGMTWMMSPRFGGIRNGELLVFNGLAGEFEFTHWEGSFPDRRRGMFSGVAAFSAEFPVAHTAAGEIYDSSSGAETEFIDSYILSPEAWVTLENGELRKHNVFEKESQLLAEGASLVGFDYEKGILTVLADGEKYLLCNGEGSELTAQYPEVPVRECLVESVLHR